jgi:cytochrome c biogenesis factor
MKFVLIFFLATMCLGANPYERLDWIPPDGRGMNPQLQNPGMAIHPPNLYLGYVGTTIPFAFAIRRAAHAETRRGVAGRSAEVGIARMVLQHHWNSTRHVVGLRRAWMGWLLGVGPC